MLEQRLQLSSVPSIMALPAVPAPPAAYQASLPFHLNGMALVTKMERQPDGSFITLAFRGTGFLIGAFQGQLEVRASNDGPAVIDAKLYTSIGSILEFTMTVDGQSGPNRPIQGTFAITGGTGLLAKASGGGSVNIEPVLATQSYLVTLDGGFSL
jgi:hypothetical protein